MCFWLVFGGLAGWVASLVAGTKRSPGVSPEHRRWGRWVVYWWPGGAAGDGDTIYLRLGSRRASSSPLAAH